jgi:hypothetical protein
MPQEARLRSVTSVRSLSLTFGPRIVEMMVPRHAYGAVALSACG